MEQICALCRNPFERGDRIVKLVGYAVLAPGLLKGIAVLVCRKHLSEEMIRVLRLDDSAFPRP